jgi:hypothetical protein
MLPVQNVSPQWSQSSLKRCIRLIASKQDNLIVLQRWVNLVLANKGDLKCTSNMK